MAAFRLLVTAAILVILLIFEFFQIAQAGWNCSEAMAKCSSESSVWIANGIGLKGGCYEYGSTNQMYAAISWYDGDRSLWSCKKEVLHCSAPKTKVGTQLNGDDKCECPSGTAAMTFKGEQDEFEAYFRVNHVQAQCAEGAGSDSDNPLVDCCMWNVPNNFCGADYKRNSNYGEPYNRIMTGITDRTYGMTNPDYCVPDAPACPTGTTSQSIVGGRATAESQNRMVAGCTGDDCCVMTDTPCAEGYLPNDELQPTDPAYCYKDGNCPDGTTAHSGFMGNSNQNYHGNFPSPAYPEYQGFCNTTGCCMGCRSGFEKSNDFCVNKSAEEPPKLCSQGTVMGAYIKTTNTSFGSGAYHTAMDCACPLNSVTRSPNAEKGVMLSGGMHIGGDPNATYQDAVCDYSKVAGNDLSQIPDLGDYFDGSKGACAMLPNGGIDKEKCFKMDPSMKDWLADNVDCGSKQGLDCISPGIQDLMAKCKVVAGVITCANYKDGDVGPAGTGQARLPDWVVDETDKFGFPLPSFDGFENIGNGTGSNSSSTTNSTNNSTTTTTTSSKDGKNPVTPFGEKEKPATGSNGNTTGGLDYFNDAWNSPKNKDLRAKIDEISAAFQRQRLVDIKMSGGEKPCFELSKVQFYKEFNWHLEDVCLLEQPYVGLFDSLRDVNLLLSMLLPAVIMLRQ